MRKFIVLTILILCLIAGCQSQQIVLHPADPNDLIIVPKGTRIGDIIIDRDGCFYSDFYQKEIMQVKVKK